jgi:hypothetical protein
VAGQLDYETRKRVSANNKCIHSFASFEMEMKMK